MRKLSDNGLTWYSCQDLIVDNGNEVVFNCEDTQQLEAFIKEINSWAKDPGISNYIHWENPGDHMRSSADRDESIYFGVEDGKLAGIMVVEGLLPLNKYQVFKDYMIECESNPILICPGFLSVDDARRALNNNNEANNSYLHYLVVNPKHRCRGVATRALDTLKNHPEHFSQTESNNLLEAHIYYTNKPSMATFKKAGFLQIPTEPEEVSGFNSLYHVVKAEDNYFSDLLSL